MVKLLPDTKATVNVRLSTLLTLADLDIPMGDLAVRPIDQDMITSLLVSDHKKWPHLLVTNTDRGYVLIDGRHRRQAAQGRGLEELKATCKAYASVEDMVEAAFTANMDHGLRSDVKTRSQYAIWLNATYPELTQEEIAKRTRLDQSTVSRAIKREEVRERKESQREPTHEELRKDAKATFRTVTRKLSSIARSFDEVDDETLVASIREVIKDEDRERIAHMAHLIVAAIEEAEEPEPVKEAPKRGSRRA